MSASPSEATVAVALALSAAGHVVHHLAEFPVAVLLAPETLVPLAVTAAVGAALVRRPGRASSALAVAWALVVVVGGGASVLPLGVLPFVPEQSTSHYAAHAAYALLQVPLLWVGVRGLRGGPPTEPSQPAEVDP